MRSHDDQVTSTPVGYIEDGLVRLVVLDMEHITLYANRCAHVLDMFETFHSEGGSVHGILLRRVSEHFGILGDDLEWPCHRHAGDPGMSCFGQCHTVLNGFGGQFEAIIRNKDVFIHAAASLGFMGIFGESLPLFGAVNLDFEFHSVSNSIIYGNGRFACIARVHRQRARPSFALMVSSVIVIKRRTVFKPGPASRRTAFASQL